MHTPLIKRSTSRILVSLILCFAFLVSSSGVAHATTYYGWFDYNRNRSNIYGCLVWAYIVNDIPPANVAAWRAGSGCYLDDRKNGGWLPSGFYLIRGHWDNYSGSSIFGRVWYLSDKRNSAGVLRTGLFIHSEETPWNGQYNPTAGDDPQCWEGDFDYRSLGCIKLAYPGDIDAAHWFWNFRGGTGAHSTGWPYPMPDRLHVHG